MRRLTTNAAVDANSFAAPRRLGGAPPSPLLDCCDLAKLHAMVDVVGPFADVLVLSEFLRVQGRVKWAEPEAAPAQLRSQGDATCNNVVGTPESVRSFICLSVCLSCAARRRSWT